MAKILVVSIASVPPILTGTQQFIHNYCQTLEKLGHEVYFLYSGRSTEEQNKIAKSFWRGRYFNYNYTFLLRVANYLKRKLIFTFTGKKYSIGFYYPVFGLDRFVENIHKEYHFDAIIVNYPWLTPLLQKTTIPNKILSTIDKFTDKRELVHAEYYSLTASQEKEALSRADQVLSIQEEETQFFKSLLPNKDIYTVYAQFEFRETLSADENNILFFSGNSDLNLNGLNYFIEKIWPNVKKNVPSAKLIVGGGICKALYDIIADSNIELVGYVDDVDEFYKRGNIAINPVYQGTGLKIKTLEGIAHGKILVVHPHSVAGLYKKEEVPVFVGDSDMVFADYLIKALKGQIDTKSISNKCHSYIDEMNAYIVEQYKKVRYK